MVISNHIIYLSFSVMFFDAKSTKFYCLAYDFCYEFAKYQYIIPIGFSSDVSINRSMSYEFFIILYIQNLNRILDKY